MSGATFAKRETVDLHDCDRRIEKASHVHSLLGK